MNHWKIMGARSLAGVLTVGMLMGQPSLLWASDSPARVSAGEKVSDTSGSGASVPSSSEKTETAGSDADGNTDADKTDAGKSDPDNKSDGEKPDTDKPAGEETDKGNTDNVSSASGLPETNGSSSVVPDGKEPSSQVPGGKEPSSQVPDGQEPSSVVPDGGGQSSQVPGGSSGSSVVPGSDEQPGTEPGSSEIPGSSGAGSSSLPESSGSQIVPGSSVVDLPEEEPEEEEEEEEEELEDENKVHAGKEFYTGQLSSQFHMVFAEDFADIMEQIEKENFARNGLDEEEVFTPALLKKEEEEGDIFHAPNWKDIVAVYVLLQKRDGAGTFYFDEDHKEAIAEVYARMNPVQEMAGEKTYISFGWEDYADQEGLEDEERKVLERYSGKECLLLCSALTGARGLIEGTFGSEVSGERADIVAAAYSLVGKISYFFGGKSSAIGWDDRWGDKREVTAEGSRSTGKTRRYGLDCSGYVTWSFINGYGKASASGKIGNGTSAQWYASRKIEKDEQILPGDLVFLQGPNHDGINHVGLVVGVKENGDVIVSHCSSGHNGVVVQEASRAGFKYIRRPKCFADGDKEVEKLLKQEEKLLKKEEEKQDSPYINKDVKVKLRTPADKEAEQESKSQEEKVFGSIEKDEEQQEEPLIPNILQKK